MTRMSTGLLLLTSLATFATVSPSGHAEVSEEVASLPEAVSVVMRAVRTPEFGASSEDSSAGPTLHVGDEGMAYLTAGHFAHDGQPRRVLCVSSVGASSEVLSAAAQSVNVWTVRSRLLEATMDAVRLEVDWSRQEAHRPGELQRVAGDRRTLTLREGAYHTLDFVSALEGGLACGRSLRVDVLAQVEEDPRFAATQLDYDLWLIDEAPGQPTRMSHLVLEGRQGENVEFELESLTWPLDGIVLPDGAAKVVATISGTLRGRVREDGRVDLVLAARRHLGIGGDSPPKGGVGDGGRKVLRVQEGETLALAFPAAQGRSSQALDGSWGSVVGAPGMTPAPPEAAGTGAVTLTKETVRVDFRRHFAGHEMSLRLTARRAVR